MDNFVRIVFGLLLVSGPAALGITSRGANNNRCLRGMSVVGSTPESATVAWNYTCGHLHRVRYKVYYEHKGWIACEGDSRSDERRGRGRGNAETDGLAASFAPLHPYSLYRVSMKALATDRATGRAVVPPEEAEVIAETAQAAPGVAPTRSVIEPRYRTKGRKKQIWQMTNCNLFLGSSRRACASTGTPRP